MADIDELGYLSAGTLIGRFRAGVLSPVEVVQALLERADERRALNALAAVDAERSLAQAHTAARRYREGDARVLEGVPVVVKDLINTAGLTTTYGSRMFAGHVPDHDAAVVSAVRAAGGIVLAKTTTHEFAWGITTDGTAAGPAHNPWRPELVPGGSSGGSAAALAAGLAPLALGTDTAGSVRIPAGFCGVTGLRPTFGTVPTDGVFPLAPSLDAVGPMARTVDDLELLFSVIAPDVAAAPAPPTSERLVIGLWEQSYQAECDSEIMDVVRAAASALAQVGAQVEAVVCDELPALYPALGATVGAEGVAGHRRAGLWPDRRDDYLPAVRHRLETASEIPLARYARAQRDRALATALIGRVFGEVDVVISPVSGVQPAPIGHDAVVDGAAAREFRHRVMAFTALQSLTGVPACVVRGGFDARGVPVGVQLTAAWGREHTLFRAARLLVQAVPDIQQRWPQRQSPASE